MSVRANRLAGPREGFTIVEMLVAMVVGSLALAGGFRLWKTHHQESLVLQRKTELRDKMALTSKRLQRSITLAGIGLNGIPALFKGDAVGSDTLVVFTNMAETGSNLLASVSSGQTSVQLENGSLFHGADFLGIADEEGGEVIAIQGVEGHLVTLSGALSGDYELSRSKAYPAQREKYFSDQDSSRLVCRAGGALRVVARNLRNFQVSFRDSHGMATGEFSEIRAVHYSYTGVFPAPNGAFNSLLFNSIAIPRNLL